jgi:type I restriction enzyme S subunit
MSNSQLRPFDVLLNITGASIGRTCIIPENIKEANINQHILYIRTKRKYVDYLSYYLKSHSTKEFINSIQAGSSKEGLNMNQTLCMPFPLPPLPEQKAIAQYLDTKTQAIDKKVSLLQKKIDYYTELRVSLINDAVTKGLDKNVELKDSGIDWIGQIPKHWGITRVKDLFKISRGRVIAKTELLDDGKFPVYSSQTENKGILGYINTYDFDTDLITWTTDGVNAGTVFRRAGKFSCTNICGTLIPKNTNKTSLDYFGYAIAESTQHNKRIDTNGAKIMSNEMAVIHIIEPPTKTEQTEIAQYLDDKTSTIDAIITIIGKQIDYLKELRKTLINDVVTGKIKVTPNN